ncbi:TonB C-terminal domain-containing protein, partial [Candidatus Thioglobus sp.]
AKTKDAELLVKEASKQLEEDQQNKDLLELEIAALKEAEAEIQYRQLLAKEVQDEQDTARSLIIEDQLNTLQNAYINNIAARVKTFWRYQSAEDDWTAEVLVVQDRDGNVKAVNVKNANVGNSSLGKSFKDSIERAVYKASPLPGAPDEAVFDEELYFIFSVN